MEDVKVPPLHAHPLIPFTRFVIGRCDGCCSSDDGQAASYIYGGYRCNESGCDALFHKECVEALPEIIHSYHPDHPLMLIRNEYVNNSRCCNLCLASFKGGYCCTICDFELDLKCVRRPPLLVLPENSYLHEHPLKHSHGGGEQSSINLTQWKSCKACHSPIFSWGYGYRCHHCDLVFHVDCVDVTTPEAYHTSHLQHPLKSLKHEGPVYADKNCLLCAKEFDQELHHCDVCNFSICKECMRNPPPVCVLSPTTHKHQLHLVPRRIDFTCNACGTLGNRSPYFCLQCNFMIHRDCIDLPRIININRHHHRISYTRRLGRHGNWTCGVCRKKVDGFYGAYLCSKCPTYVVHARCATRDDVWDMVELEGIPEEPEEPAPFEVIDDKTIKHFSHDHYLQFNKDVVILPESTLCVACVFQICSESFYRCMQCDFILHKTCANLPRKKRHVSHNQQFTLRTKPPDSDSEAIFCMDDACGQQFTGFRYESDSGKILDVRCGSITEPFVHDSHPHPLYYSTDHSKSCSECGKERRIMFSCDECDYSLDFKCALLPKRVMKHRYDDHPLFLSYGDMNVDEKYWCEACETKVVPKRWFYSCSDCGVVLHISCLVGDFSYVMPDTITASGKVVANTSICRPLCYACKSRCNLSSIQHNSGAIVNEHFCSDICLYSPGTSVWYEMLLRNFKRENEFKTVVAEAGGKFVS